MTARRVDPNELVSVIDIAMMLGIGQSAVSNWQKRHGDFPEPVVRVSNGHTALWLRDDILRWHRNRMTDDERNDAVARLKVMLNALEA